MVTTFFKIEMLTSPQIQLLPPTYIHFQKWSCEVLSKQGCENVKDDLERYLASRVMTWHHERHCNHLDHFDQVMAYRLFQGISNNLNELIKSGSSIKLSNDKLIISKSVNSWCCVLVKEG